MWVGLLAIAGCIAVEGEKILARDLAAVDAAFSVLPAETDFGYAPAPGARRFLSAEELKRKSSPYELSLAPGATVCVVRPLEPLTEERLVAAMRASLKQEPARIEVLDFSRFPVPKGELEFPLSGLARPPESAPQRPVIWRGRVRYAEGRYHPVWARVRVLVSTRRLVARRDLAARRGIEAGDVELVEVEAPPGGPVTIEPEQAIGKVTRRAIRAGSAVWPHLLEAPREVSRGEKVLVRVASGAALIETVGLAETAGSVGETVLVKNASTGKRFQARVTGKAEVEVATVAEVAR